MSFAVRQIDLTIQLGTGNFGTSGQNTIKLSGLRVEVAIEAVAGGGPEGRNPHAVTAIVHVYGLTLSLVNQFSVAGLQWAVRNNTIIIAAGDAQSGMSTVFRGTILDAFPDYSNMPETAFVFTSRTGQFLSLQPVPAISYPGAVAAATVMGTLAKNAGLTLENSGVTTRLSSPYFAGTVIEQIRQAAQAAQCYAFIDSASNTLAIWPRGGSRSAANGTVPVISPAMGSIGYPAVQRVSGIFRTLFDPTIRVGRQVQVKSDLTAANGLWNVYQMQYHLASQLPGGPWEMVLNATAPGAPS